MKTRLTKYMSKFTSLSEEEQQAIIDQIQIEKQPPWLIGDFIVVGIEKPVIDVNQEMMR